MKINNFNQIATLLKFPNDDAFYVVQIIKRRKENPKMRNGQKVVMVKYITSLDHFESSQNELISIAEATNSRVYINLNAKSYKRTSFQLLTTLASKLESGDFKTAYIFDKATGFTSTHHKENEKTWIIDIDHDMSESDLNDFSNKLEALNPVGNKVVKVLPTANGFHIISKPFQLDRLGEVTTDLKEVPDVHKNNPTIAYANCKIK